MDETSLYVIATIIICWLHITAEVRAVDRKLDELLLAQDRLEHPVSYADATRPDDA